MVFKHYTNDVLKDMHSTTYCNNPSHAGTIFDHSTITFILNQCPWDNDLSNISFTLKVKLIFQNCTVLWPVLAVWVFPYYKMYNGKKLGERFFSRNHYDGNSIHG